MLQKFAAVKPSETPIAHLAMAVCPGIPLEQIHMALLTSYFDASGDNAGTHGVTVGGYVSDVRAWGRFSVRWREVLDEYGIEHFHMTDFVAGGKGFERFRKKPDLQAEVLGKLARVVRKNVRKSFATSILLEDWRAANQVYRLKECHATPYAICSLSVISNSLLWIGGVVREGRRRAGHEFTEFVFEEGDNGQGDFKWLMNVTKKLGGGKLDAIYPVFKPKTLLPLQSCDFAAWEKRRVIKEHLDRVDAPPRESLDELLKIPHQWGVIDKHARLKYANWLCVPKRDDA
ncbi:MAG: hypothetical protein AB7P34_05565, partial [Vicinamibacterales bacterium]